jgi:hypothetical protein
MQSRTYFVLFNDTRDALGIYNTMDQALEVKKDMDKWDIKRVFLKESRIRTNSRPIPQWPKE